MLLIFFLFFFNDTATTEIYTLSLHDALPICPGASCLIVLYVYLLMNWLIKVELVVSRSEEHTSELQSRSDLVCRLLLEKKKKYSTSHTIFHIHSDDLQCSTHHILTRSSFISS